MELLKVGRDKRALKLAKRKVRHRGIKKFLGFRKDSRAWRIPPRASVVHASGSAPVARACRGSFDRPRSAGPRLRRRRRPPRAPRTSRLAPEAQLTRSPLCFSLTTARHPRSRQEEARGDGQPHPQDGREGPHRRLRGTTSRRCGTRNRRCRFHAHTQQQLMTPRITQVSLFRRRALRDKKAADFARRAPRRGPLTSLRRPPPPRARARARRASSSPPFFSRLAEPPAPTRRPRAPPPAGSAADTKKNRASLDSARLRLSPFRAP